MPFRGVANGWEEKIIKRVTKESKLFTCLNEDKDTSK